MREVIMATKSGTKTSQNVKALVNLKQKDGGLLNTIVNGIVGNKQLLLELVSDQHDTKSNSIKQTIKGTANETDKKDNKEAEYEATFEIPANFGNVGAVLVQNEHDNEIFLQTIVLNGFPNGPLHFNCQSWIQPKHHNNPTKRVFFTNKVYLPSQTPSGLKKLREDELIELRGNGEGERKKSDRIYDYDVYNDLGDPDINIELKRPVLGRTKQFPYPRRCRTGRKHSHSDKLYEKRTTLDFYVPRDEVFGETKQTQFNTSTVSLGLTTVIQSLDTILTDPDQGFANFEDIEAIYKEGFQLPSLKPNDLNFLQKIIPKFIMDANDSKNLIRFDAPEPYKRDRFFWFSDLEFARETLAGANPYSIQLVKELPLTSKLDALIYGPPESAITREIIESQMTTYNTVEEAIKEKKLFMIDYHDLYLPYVSKVREIKGTTLYGSRTLFFLNSEGILKPLAIELTRPPIDGKAQWKQVFTPSSHSTNLWLWRLAKAHVLAHDSGHHELISHWLRTHCVVEPFIIATHRQLSSMHPIYRLLHPHLRYTMEINKVAREVLINANGFLEISFFPKKYTMELSSVAYDKLWQFDLQALPNDLINRGMAVEDPSAQHGVKLIIEDYPFANDGLLIWDAIKQWVTDYVNHYYPSSSIVESDQELQAWWTEIRTKGHADKSEEYIGQNIEPSWGENPTIKVAFERFQRRLQEIEVIIDSRNEDKNLKNRHGAGVVPYESLKPFSGPGVTGKGVPYSISI